MIKFSVAERVAPTAKISGIKGSLAKRAEIAAAKNAEFFGMVSDVFQKRGEVTGAEIETFFRKLIPGVHLEVTKFRKNPDETSRAGLEKSYSERGFDGFVLHLPILTNGSNIVLPASCAEELFHESRHLFDEITNPRAVAFSDDTPYLYDLNQYKCLSLGRAASNVFYSSKLYSNKLSAKGKANMGKNPDKARNKRKSAIKKEIIKFFKFYQMLANEKIETLEKWRQSLKSEITAYKDGINYKYNLGVGKHYPSAQEEIKGLFRHFFFDGKIEVIEEVLAEELAKTRNAHAKSIGKKGNHRVYKSPLKEFVRKINDPIRRGFEFLQQHQT